MPLHSPLLRYFDEVRRAGSIRAAARTLNISSSAVNRRILQLESELGVPVFERLPGRLRLTAAGEVLADHVRRVLQDEARVVSEIEALQGLQTGRIALAAVEGVAVDFLPAVLAETARRYPRVEIAVDLAESAEVADRVSDGDAEVGLGFPIAGRRELRLVAVRGFPFGAVMPPDHRLAVAERLDLSELLGEALILPAATSHAGAIIQAIADRRGLPLRAAIRSSGIGFAKHAALAGLGVAFQTRLGIEPELASGRLVHVPLVDGEPLVQELAILVRAERALPVAAARLVDLLTDRLLAV